ncbi:2-oxoacid:ferredoxin oxidoreductase subunit beta [Thermoplasmatales archaeon ex4484_30]|nr:MAG: 2-oxoacid:ferredoxin oxidoreductase subunit beta [Thermoplasmatales archaeon ex4484_30]
MQHETERHPLDSYLRPDRIPHIWCPGCGLGIVLNAYLRAIEELNLDLKKLAVVSGIGCTGRVAGYVNVDSYHTTHGRAIPFATGLKLANPDINVTVFSGDGDLFAIGGNHFLHAARRNVDLTVICVNNYNYGMTGGQLGPTTPLGGKTSTSPYGNIEHPFNLCHVAAAAGAVYVARWTALHARRLANSIKEAIQKKGFSFVEVIAACPTTYGRRNKMPTGLDEMKYYREHSVIRHGADPAETDIEIGKDIIVGKFVDIEKETFHDALEKLYKKVRK